MPVFVVANCGGSWLLEMVVWCGCVLAGVREEEAEEDKVEKKKKINIK